MLFLSYLVEAERSGSIAVIIRVRIAVVPTEFERDYPRPTPTTFCRPARVRTASHALRGAATLGAFPPPCSPETERLGFSYGGNIALVPLLLNNGSVVLLVKRQVIYLLIRSSRHIALDDRVGLKRHSLLHGDVQYPRKLPGFVRQPGRCHEGGHDVLFTHEFWEQRCLRWQPTSGLLEYVLDGRTEELENVLLVDGLFLPPTLALDDFRVAILDGNQVAPQVFKTLDDALIVDSVSVHLAQVADVPFVVATYLPRPLLSLQIMVQCPLVLVYGRQTCEFCRSQPLLSRVLGRCLFRRE